MRPVLLMALLAAAIAVGPVACGEEEAATRTLEATSTPELAPDETEVPLTSGMAWVVSGTAAATTSAPTAAATTPAPTAAAEVEDRTQAEALLKAASLRQEDLPEGFTLEGERFFTNEDLLIVNEVWNDLWGPADGPTLEDLNRWGRILGYSAVYEVEETLDPSFSGTAVIQVAMELLRDSSGARDYFEFITRGDLSDPEYLSAFQGGDGGWPFEIRDLSISSIPVAAVGDQRFGFEVKGTMYVPELDWDMLATYQWIGMRSGPTATVLAVLAIGTSPSTQELQDLARKLDERLKDALE